MTENRSRSDDNEPGNVPPSASGGPPPGGHGGPPPGGHGGPPPGGYGGPPPGWQGVPGGHGGPPGGDPQQDRAWILATHFGGAGVAFLSGGVFGWIVPLVTMLSRGPQSPVVRSHALDALNFQVLWSIVAVAGYILGTCGTLIVVGFVLFALVAVALVMEIVFGIVAGVKAVNGQPYRYPGSPNWIR